MSRILPRWMAFALSGFTMSTDALAFTDYDPQSGAWNGTRELIRIATEAEVDLHPVSTLDWDEVQRGQGILVLYPLNNIGLADLSSFLDDGGRVAWLDDFGESGPFLDWFQFRREATIRGAIPRTPDLPELLLARPHAQHPLTAGVDMLVTNVPTALSHRSLTPYYIFAGSNQGLLLVGQIGQGRLVVGGDPSVVINTMMRFPGNRRFSRNLVDFLASHRGGRITMVTGDFRVRGFYHGRARTGHTRDAVNKLNDMVHQLSQTLSLPTVMRPFAMTLALLVSVVMTVIMWGRRPSERYGPRGPEGSVAGLTERVGLFGSRKANFLFPAMVARKVLESSLLRASGLKAPVDIRYVLERTAARLSEAQRAEVKRLLVELDALGERADEGPKARLDAGRFLSLWKRIGAILAAVSVER